MTTLETAAYFFAKGAHAGQYRRDGYTPYFTHCDDVFRRVRGEDARVVAILHDVFEDTEATVDDLLEVGLSEEHITAITLLTKKIGESYEDYLAKIKQNKIAREVKLADMASNLSDDPTDRQREKYSKGINFLAE